jgi:hypothetical protein
MEIRLTFDDKGRRKTGVGTTPVSFDLTAYAGAYVQVWSDEDLYFLPSGKTSAPSFDTGTDQSDRGHAGPVQGGRHESLHVRPGRAADSLGAYAERIRGHGRGQESLAKGVLMVAVRRLGAGFGKRFGAGRAFRFSDIPGLVFDGNPISSKVTLNGSDVQTLEDSYTQDSGGAQNFSQGTASAQPAYDSSDTEINSRPSMNFDGSGDWLEGPDELDLTGGDHLLVFAVAKSDSDAAGSDDLINKRAKSSPFAGWMMEMSSANQMQFIIDDGSNSANAQSASTVNDGAWHIFEGAYDDLSGECSLVIDGGSAATSTDANLSGSDKSHSGALEIAQFSFASRYWKGDIARILVYIRSSSPFTSNERTSIRSELASLYGVSV